MKQFLCLKTDEMLNLFVKNPHILIGYFVKNLGHSVIFLTEIGVELGDIARYYIYQTPNIGLFFMQEFGFCFMSPELAPKKLM